ncbi:arylsulfatase [bacterium]|nr:arylsulfatase [bacterium]
MKRRQFLQHLGSIGLLASVTPVLKCTRQKKPNIVFIMADDLGYGELGCFGQEKIETPNIDDLAQNGMRFTQFYSGAPVCAPARCILMTGMHSGHAYIRGNDEWGERGDVWDYAKAVEDPNLEGQRPMPSGTVTIAELMKKAGYKTGIVGKWGLGGPLTNSTPNKQGFDFFFGYNCQRQAHTYYPKHLWRNEEKVWLENDLVVPGTLLEEGADPYDPASYEKYNQPQYAPDLMFDEIIGFVERNQEQPFFVYWASTIPHVPVEAPKRWVDYYVRKLGDEEPYLGQEGYFPCRYPRATYAGMVSCLDEQVGLLIAKLKELGLYENTVVLFTSDNGSGIRGGSQSSWFDTAKPFITETGRTKGTVYEGGIRVPLIATWPGRIQSGSTSNHIAAFQDVMPTLCELGRTAHPEETDGISFVNAMLGLEQQQHDYLYWEYPGSGGQQAVRMGKWKGMRRDMHNGNTTIQLYDLESDIQETRDVAKDHPDIVLAIQEIMDEAHQTPEIDLFKMDVLEASGS